MLKWVPVANFEDYVISSCGDVARANDGPRLKKAQRLTVQDNGCGYKTVCLYKEGKQHRKYVHRLVLESFVGPPPFNSEGNHKNGARGDNRLVNLEWVSRTANLKHSYAVLDRNPTVRRGETNASAKLTELKVKHIKHLLKNSRLTQRSIASIFKVSPSTIRAIKHKRIWKSVPIIYDAVNL